MTDLVAVEISSETVREILHLCEAECDSPAIGFYTLAMAMWVLHKNHASSNSTIHANFAEAVRQFENGPGMQQ